MPSRELPARPNLEQLKKQAKSLLDAAKARDAGRARGASPFCPRSRVSLSTRSAPSDLALHDAQSVVAREHGFASWNALREEVESRTLSFDAARRRVRPLRHRRRDRSRGATARAPSAYRDSHAADRARPRRRRERLRSGSDTIPNSPSEPGGPQNWEPLLYVVPHVHAQGRSGPRGRSRRHCPSSLRARARIRTPSTTGTGIPSFRGRRCGRRSAPSGICRLRKCCSKPARIRPTA